MTYLALPTLLSCRRCTSILSFSSIFRRNYSSTPIHSSLILRGEHNAIPNPTESAGPGRIIPTDLNQEMKQSYIEYAMSVILGRAIPDVRDGLKPVHRRILYAMNQLGLDPKKQFRKSARVVGEVLGKYHPHGDTAVYDALVRMAQPFSMSLPLIDGHGNFGSTDGDPAAAMRYTECRMSPVSKYAFMSDMDRDTVSFASNFDGSESEPLVLPAKIPNLLVNGSSGIAVGMATNIPPHNLAELVSALKAIIAEPDVSDQRLLELVPAPDFPTGGQIVGTEGARDLYLTGQGKITVRAVVHIEQIPGNAKRRARHAIIVTELPFKVNKATLVEKIANLANDKKLDGILDLRDESDRSGTRIVIEVKRSANVVDVLESLYKKSKLENSFGGNLMALDNGYFPVRFSLRECLQKFLEFRRETVRRRAAYDLKTAKERLHIVQGLVLAQRDIGKAIDLIRESQNSEKAQSSLMETFGLSKLQSNAVVDMQFRKLPLFESGLLLQENEDLVKTTSELQAILLDPSRIDEIISNELEEAAKQFSTVRRSAILPDTHSVGIGNEAGELLQSATLGTSNSKRAKGTKGKSSTRRKRRKAT